LNAGIAVRPPEMPVAPTRQVQARFIYGRTHNRHAEGMKE